MQGTAPRVSILLPAFNAEGTLGACLHSIGRQNLGEWECVVVDDGSTDGTAGVARRFSAADGRVTVVTRPHGGLVEALNAGLKHCRGVLVARMDADDLMHSRRLAEQCALLESRPELDAVGCHVRLFPRRGLGAGMREYERWLNAVADAEAVRREAFIECPVAHPSLVVRREVLGRLGYREMGWPEDYDLLLRMLEEGVSIGMLPRRRLMWRHDERRLSQTDAVYATGRFTECKASFLARSFLSGGERYVLWGYGGTGRALRAALERHGKRASHIVEVHPGRLGNRIRGAPVVPPTELPRIRRDPLLVSVSGSPAREEIRSTLRELGFVETRDYFCTA